MAPGGSAEVVAFKRHGIPLAISGSARASLDASEIGPVIDIVTPRRKETSAADEVSVRPWGTAVIGRHRGGSSRACWHAPASSSRKCFGREVADEPSSLSDDERRELEAWETFEALDRR